MVGLFDENGSSKIGLGTWQLGLKGWGKDYEESELVEALKFGINNGLNFVDTAEIYGMGKSESIVGEVVSELERKQFFIATKLAGFNATKKKVRKSLTSSLKRLKVDYLDLYQVHWEPSLYTNMADLFRELEEVAKEGLINHIGTSNFSIKSIEKANGSMKELKIESNQIKFNLVERPNPEMLSFMKANAIKLIAWSPLAQGFLTGKYSGRSKPSGSVRKINRLFSSSSFERFAPFLSELRKISDQRKVSPVQLVLAYEKHIGVLPIPGFKNVKQVKDLVAANSLKLSDQEVSSIDLALQKSGVLETSIGFYPRILPNFIAKLGFLLI